MYNKIEFKGIKEFENRYSKKTLKRIEKAVLSKIANLAKKDVKANIRQLLKRKSGMLLKGIYYKKLAGSAYMLNAKKTGYYAAMHEGGTGIREPRKKNYLQFYNYGRWIRIKSVAGLKSKWFFYRAVNAIERGKYNIEIDAFMQKLFNEIEAKNGL